MHIDGTMPTVLDGIDGFSFFLLLSVLVHTIDTGTVLILTILMEKRVWGFVLVFKTLAMSHR